MPLKPARGERRRGGGACLARQQLLGLRSCARRKFVVRNDHGRTIARDGIKSFSEIYRQPHTTVRCWITGQVTGVHGNAGPRQPLHVWHLRPFVNIRFVTDLLLHNSEHTRGSRMAFCPSADSRLTDADAIAVNIHSLFRKTDDDHDWSCGRNLRMPQVVTWLELARYRLN